MLKKKSVAKAKIFFLLIQSAPFPCPRHPPLSFNSSLLQFKSSLFDRTDSGVSLLNGCRLPISRILGEKAGPSPAGKKIHFSSDIARCSTRARLPKECRTFRNLLSIFLHSYVLFNIFIFRNLPNPKLLVHGPKASYVSKRTQSYHDLPKARASYRRRDNVMSYVTSGGWGGLSIL